MVGIPTTEPNQWLPNPSEPPDHAQIFRLDEETAPLLLQYYYVTAPLLLLCNGTLIIIV